MGTVLTEVATAWPPRGSGKGTAWHLLGGLLFPTVYSQCAATHFHFLICVGGNAVFTSRIP